MTCCVMVWNPLPQKRYPPSHSAILTTDYPQRLTQHPQSMHSNLRDGVLRNCSNITLRVFLFFGLLNCQNSKDNQRRSIYISREIKGKQGRKSWKALTRTRPARSSQVTLVTVWRISHTRQASHPIGLTNRAIDPIGPAHPVTRARSGLTHTISNLFHPGGLTRAATRSGHSTRPVGSTCFSPFYSFSRPHLSTPNL